VRVPKPAGPGAEPGHTKHLAQARLERRVRPEIVCPYRHGLEGAAHCIRGGTRGHRDKGVDLAISFVIVTFNHSAFLRKVGRSRAVPAETRTAHTEAGWVMEANMAPATCIVRASVEVRTHISAGSIALRNLRRSW
jgi:hypothetical protein